MPLHFFQAGYGPGVLRYKEINNSNTLTCNVQCGYSITTLLQYY